MANEIDKVTTWTFHKKNFRKVRVVSSGGSPIGINPVVQILGSDGEVDFSTDSSEIKYISDMVQKIMAENK